MSDVTDLSDGRAELEAESPVSIVREPHIHHGIFMAGTRELGPQEADLKYEFYLQHIYMVRGVNVDGLGIPQQCYAEARACGLIACGQATWDQLRRLLNTLPTDKSLRWPQDSRVQHTAPKRFTAGAWARGPMTGVNVFARRFPWTARLLSGIIATWDETLEFSTITLSVNVCAKPHRDSHNHALSHNLMLPFSDFTGGELFLETRDGRHQLAENGPRGHIMSATEPLSFSPRRLHATLPWDGDRCIMIAFHIGMWSNLSHEDRVELLQMGFRLGAWEA